MQQLTERASRQFCNVILWPLFHSLPQRSDSRLLDNFSDKYDAYCAANQKFLEVSALVRRQLTTRCR